MTLPAYICDSIIDVACFATYLRSHFTLLYSLLLLDVRPLGNMIVLLFWISHSHIDITTPSLLILNLSPHPLMSLPL